MLYHAPLLTTIAAALVSAFVLGMVTQKLRLSPIVGYLAAGLLIGPFTPGFVGDPEIAVQLAEIGVILLMFGVGLQFSFKELLAVRNVALPGALVQMTLATAAGTGFGLLLGWGIGASLLFGLALSVASTVVMLRALEDRQLLDTRAGHIAIGWLIVEDLAMVLALVIIPVVATGAGGPLEFTKELAMTGVKVTAFVVLMVVVGRRAIPWLLAKVADTGSRELFILGILALGIGVAVGAAWIFDVSFALGAFFAGMILRESELSQRAAEDSLPLRDAFAVLFFVSVGMLVDPAVFYRQPLALLATVVVIVAGKFTIAYVLVRALRYSKRMSLVVAAALAQAGEFSFILVTLGTEYQILPSDAGDLVLAGAMVSIVLNPLLFAWASRAYRASEADDATPKDYDGRGHVIVVGFGRVGARVAQGLWDRQIPLVVVDDDETRVSTMRAASHEAILGNGVRAKVLRAAGIDDARMVIIAIPEPLNAGAIIAKVRSLRPEAVILARGHREVDVDYLTELGATRVLVGVHEVADLMVSQAVLPEDSAP